MYLGAKHMVTGYDHLLFLVGVIFFRNLSDTPLTIVLEVNGYFTKLGRIEGPATP